MPLSLMHPKWRSYLKTYIRILVIAINGQFLQNKLGKHHDTLEYHLYLMTLISISIASPTMGATHHIPDTLQAEQKVLEKNLQTNYTAENLFELAMNYAMSGWIELAWNTLKQILIMINTITKSC